jgi:hypothetical protein
MAGDVRQPSGAPGEIFLDEIRIVGERSRRICLDCVATDPRLAARFANPDADVLVERVRVAPLAA